MPAPRLSAKPVRHLPPPCLCEADIAHVAHLWKADLFRAAPALCAEVDPLLSRISPPNWALEWSLPAWLGEAFGLDRAEWLPLVLSNVMGLAHIRIQDDLLDNVLSGERRSTWLLLSATLYRLWIDAYVDQFGGDSRFWQWFRRCMEEWTHATWSSVHRGRTPKYDDALSLRLLAHLGSPLKICVAGACLLAGKPERTATIAAAVERVLGAAVLLDHLYDWEDDLDRNRQNAFVSYAAGRAGGAPSAPAVRRAIAQEFLTGDTGRPYINVILRELKTAREHADTEHVPGLVAFASWLHDETRAHGEELAQVASAQLRSLVARLSSCADDALTGVKTEEEVTGG